MAEYNPFKDFNPNFTYYTAPKVDEKVELVNPFEDFNPTFTTYKQLPEIEDPLYGKIDISS